MKGTARTARSAPLMRRRGFSLIEVILATAILLGSAVLLLRLIGLGRSYAQDTRQYNQAQRVCENTINEILLGLRPASPVESSPLLALRQTAEDLPEPVTGELLQPGVRQDVLKGTETEALWLHSIRLEPEPGPARLQRLTVEVRRRGSRIRCVLTRWIRGSGSGAGSESIDREGFRRSEVTL